jgi:phage/plasmid-like protein (TIGR03299 family)
MIDTTTGRAAIAYVGETPWHGLGAQLAPDADLLEWRRAAGLNWSAEKVAVEYITDAGPRQADGLSVLYRSDTRKHLSVVSDGYKVVQPVDVLEFYRDLTEQFGYQLETAGAIKDGRVIWGLARTGQVARIRGTDLVNGYVLLSTSFDGSMATQARLTSVRVVCNNTLTIATQGRAGFSCTHRGTFDADKAKEALGIGAFAQFEDDANRLAETRVTQKQQVEFLLSVYHGIKAGDVEAIKANEQAIDKTMNRLAGILANAPGQQIASAAGTAWGLVNAVTHDMDFSRPARSQENRLHASWFGTGATTKQVAWQEALALAA